MPTHRHQLGRLRGKSRDALFHLDVRGLDDRPPFVDFGSVKGAVLQRVVKRSLAKMTQSFRILTADLRFARLLDLPLNAPIGEVRRVITNHRNEILYLGFGRYRGDLVVFNTTIEVPQTT